MSKLEHAPGLVIARNMDHIKELSTPISQAIGISLAGGRGSRMEEITKTRTSKTVLPIASSSVLMDGSIALMRMAGIEEIHILTSESVVDSQNNHSRRHPLYEGTHVTVEHGQKGVGPALKTFLETHPTDKPIITTNADEIYPAVDLQSMYQEHTWNNHPITGLLTPYPQGTETDKYWIDPGTKKITKKLQITADTFSTDGYEGSGIWIIEPSQFPLLKNSPSWHDFLRTTIANGDVYGFVSDKTIWNVNTPSDLEDLRNTIKR